MSTYNKSARLILKGYEMICKLPLQLFRTLPCFRNKSTNFDQKQRAFRQHVTNRVKSEIFILQTTCHYQYETPFSKFFRTQLTHNILRNFSKKFSPHMKKF